MDDQDDGLMLNFASGGDPPRTKPNRAREKFDRMQQSTRPAPAPIEAPAAKRSRVEPTPTPISRKAHTTRENSRNTLKSTAVKLPPGGIISSLFDAHSSTVPLQTSQPQKEYQPTNAPSTSSDFTSLGLDPLLVAHLATKMNIGTRPTSIQKLALPPLLVEDSSRDVFIQAQTGSGKTLTYLLPIVQSLLPLCQESFIDRSVGTLAIVLAPTRELARQIYEVLEKLVSLALTLKEQQLETKEEQESIRRTRWLVPGLLCGGSTRNHEKQRLRKGCPILVSTPGRLLDHLRNTESFDVGKCRWLILDEADRLLEMGFEEQLNGIINALDGRRRLACGSAREAMPAYDPEVTPGSDDWIRDQHVMDSTGLSWWAHRRRVVLCSATLDENVQVLAGKTLQSPLVLRGGKEAPSEPSAGNTTLDLTNSTQEEEEPRFSAPAQLEQNYLLTPPKLRLVTLLALLRSYLSRAKKAIKVSTDKGSGRVIVFMSCTDSVDFHWKALGGASMSPDDEEEAAKKKESISQSSELIPMVPIFKLHGSMSQADRIASLRAFSKSQDEGAILLCTSVASRGLDLPQVGCVVQLDPPTEGGIEEYLHRVGRTARVGKKGESWLLVLPQEEGWVSTVLEQNILVDGQAGKIRAESVEKVLMSGFGGGESTLEYQSRATDVQLAFERWVLNGGEAELARKAFLSHVRAYATHPAEEKGWFNVRSLHLGHLAKAFALREAPKNLGKSKSTPVKALRNKRQCDQALTEKDDFELSTEQVKNLALSTAASAPVIREQKGETDAEKRMYAKVRAMGKNSRRNGVLAAHGAGEFQLG